MKAAPHIMLLAGVLAASGAHAQSFSSTDATLQFDSNATNARLAGDVRSDTSLSTSALLGQRIDLDEWGLLDLSARLSLAAHARFAGLDALALDGRADLHRKLGLGLYVPTLHLRLDVAHQSFSAELRDGWFSESAIVLEQRLSPLLLLHADAGLQYRSQAHDQVAVAGVAGNVFTQFDQVQSLGVLFAPVDHLSASLELRRRAGDADLTIHGGPGADFGEALAISPDPAFGANSFAERVKAVSHGVKASISYELGPRARASAALELERTREAGGDVYHRALASVVYSYDF